MVVIGMDRLARYGQECSGNARRGGVWMPNAGHIRTGTMSLRESRQGIAGI